MHRLAGKIWSEMAAPWLRGFAYIAFTGRPYQGFLVLVAIFALSPWSALGAALGGLAAVLLGQRLFSQSEEEWRLGLGAYDCVVVGILWSGVLAQGSRPAALFPLAILACLALREPTVRRTRAWGLPPLAMPALATAWLSIAVFGVFYGDLWGHPGALPFGPVGIAIAIAAIGGAMFATNAWATAAAVLAGMVAGFIHYELGGDPFSIAGAGLWAFTVVPAAFAAPAVFLSGFRVAWTVSLIAAPLSTALWLLWINLPYFDEVPPLMAPLFIGLWGGLALALGRERALCLDPEIQRAARMIEAAKSKGGTLALTGAGVSTASGIPDYTSGAWLDPMVPLVRYSFAAFVAERENRRLYWAAGTRFRDVALRARPNAGHRALATLQAAGHLTAIVTQNVDGLHQAAGSRRVVEVHGTIARVRCLTCGVPCDWPGEDAWQASDPRCPACEGLLKPATIAFGEDVPMSAWRTAEAEAVRCGALLVVGTQLAVSSATALVASARARGASCVFIALGPLTFPVFPGDVVLFQPAESALPALARLLHAGGKEAQ